MRGRSDHGPRVVPDGKTLAEIGRELGISAARVLQLQQRAMEKMRQTILDEPDLIEVASEVLGCDARKLA